MKNKILTLCLVCLSLFGNGVNVWADPSSRTVLSLTQEWECRPISTVNKKAAFVPVTIPHTWNADPVNGTTLYERLPFPRLFQADVDIPLSGAHKA